MLETGKSCTAVLAYAILVSFCAGFQQPYLTHHKSNALSSMHNGISPHPARSLQRSLITTKMVVSKPNIAESSERSRPPEALADTVYNFAFGSNLNPEKRSSRGVNGTGIVSRSTFPAVVKGFRLAFNLPMFPPVEPGMAALARAREGEDDSCHGLLLELTNEEYQKMWNSEGGMAAKPPYEETVVEATTYDGRYADRIVSQFLLSMLRQVVPAG